MLLLLGAGRTRKGKVVTSCRISSVTLHIFPCVLLEYCLALCAMT